ncbi:MAG: hypothetical protein ABSC05_26370, partial [Candidatus Solibacter sp.]
SSELSGGKSLDADAGGAATWQSVPVSMPHLPVTCPFNYARLYSCARSVPGAKRLRDLPYLLWHLDVCHCGEYGVSVAHVIAGLQAAVASGFQK